MRLNKNNQFFEKGQRIVKSVAVRAIRSKVLPKWSFEDISQELWRKLCEIKNWYKKDNAYLWTSLKNEILRLRNRELTDRRIVNNLAISIFTEVKQRDGNTITLEETIPDPRCSLVWDSISRKVAVEEALVKLLPIEQKICHRRMKGHSIKRIAEEMYVHRKTIEYRIRKIRRLFEKQGLKGEL